MRGCVFVALVGCTLPTPEQGLQTEVQVGDDAAPVLADPVAVEISDGVRTSLRDGVRGWLDDVAKLDVSEALDVAVEMRDHASGRCPIMEPTPYGQAWSATPCETKQGAVFTGRWSEATENLSELVPVWLAEPWVVMAIEASAPDWRPSMRVDSSYVQAFDANGRVQPLNGPDLVLSGPFREVEVRWDDLGVRQVVVGGPWWDVADNPRAIPDLEILEVSTSRERVLWARGWLTGMSGGVTAVFSEGIRSVPRCGLEAAGTLEALDEQGRHYRIELDGDVQCDGCAEVWRDDVLLSPLCLEQTEGQLGL